jgi:hypothetical protein
MFHGPQEPREYETTGGKHGSSVWAGCARENGGQLSCFHHITVCKTHMLVTGKNKSSIVLVELLL